MNVFVLDVFARRLRALIDPGAFSPQAHDRN
jgi:hypothetical protein